MARPQIPNRHDPAAARQSTRQGREKGVRVYIAADDLRAAGIDPHGEPPTYRMWVDPKRKGSVLVRLYHP